MKQIYTFIFFVTLLSAGFFNAGAASQTRLSDLFIENRGQVKTEKGSPADNVLFYKGGSMKLYITTTGYSVVVKTSAKGKPTYNKIDFKFANSKIRKDQVVFVKDHPVAFNIYGPGNKQLSALQSSKTVLIKNIYPGIDWLWTIDKNGAVNHDFMVNIGADASIIQYSVEGAEIDNSGGDIIKYGNQNFRLKEGPVVFKTRQKDLAGKIEVKGGAITFAINDELKKGGFTIDPPLQLDWSSGLDSGNHTGFRSIVADDTLNTFTVGYSNDFTLPVFPQSNGSLIQENPENTDAVIMKTDSNQNLLWATFFGGSNNDEANAVVTTPTGIFVVGYSESWDFPVEPSLNGNYDSLVSLSGRDAFIAKFNRVGVLQWSTGYGGNTGADEAEDIKYYNGNVYVAGYTASKNFPVLARPGAYNATHDAQGNAEGFLLEFDTAGNRQWATCFGGSGNDYMSSLFVDQSGIYTTGYSDTTAGIKIPLKSYGSAYFDTTYHRQESFVTLFSLSDSLLWSTYFGGSANNFASCIVRNSCGVYICGKATAGGLPVLDAGGGDYYQPNYGGGNSDGFIAGFDPSLLNETYCTYYGDTGTEALTRFASDVSCNIIFTGFSNSPLPVPNPTPYYFDQAAPRRGFDGLMLGMDINRNIFWSTLFGGWGNDFGYGLQFSNIYLVDMVGETFYNFGRDTIGGTFPSDEIPCPFVTTNGESNRFYNCELINGVPGLGDGNGLAGSGGCSNLEFQSVIPLKTACPNECNGWAEMDTANIGGCSPYAFLWSDGGQKSKDTTLCTNYWGRVIDPATGQSRTIYSKFDVLRVPAIGIVNTNCLNVPNWDSIIKPAGGEPPYTIAYRGTSNTSCPTTAYFAVTDSVNCVVSFATPWYQNNINLTPLLTTSTSCDLVANFHSDTSNCVNTNYSGSWKYVIYSKDDTIIVPFDATTSMQRITSPTHSGYYYGYLDMGDCRVPLQGFFFYQKPNYHIRRTPDCLNDNGAITIVVYPDTAALQFYGSDSVYVTVFDSTTNSRLQRNLLVIPTTGPDSITISNLPGHTYWISVNHNSCDSTKQSADLTTVNFYFNYPFVVCGDSTKLKGIVNDGVPPYTFAWSTHQADSGFIYIDSPSIYTLTVTDASHCVAVASDTVYGTLGLHIDSIVSLNTECPYTDGNVIAAQVYFTGGSSPFTYLWSSGAQAAKATNLSPSVNNTVLITDLNNCSVTGAYFLSLPPPVNAYDTSWTPICYDSTGGRMNVYITGGFADANGNGYRVTWQGNQYSDSMAANATLQQGYLEASATLFPDYYKYVVTDYYGCTYTGYDSVKVPVPISYALDTINCLCFGDNSGGAGLINIQSNISYSVLWSTGANSDTVTGLYSGYYTATITDSNNCVYNTAFYVSQPPPLMPLIDSGLGIVCHNGTALVNIDGTGGTPPYADTATYQLSAGTYNFFIQDSNSCLATFTFHLTNPPAFSDSIWVNQPVCNNGYQSEINVTAMGGVEPYNLMVDSMYNVSFYGLGQIIAAPTGNASVVVTDAHGCTLTSNTYIDSNYQAIGTITGSNPFCAGSNSGSATITITGGQAPYNYNGDLFYSTYTIYNLDSGSYTFVVYDSLGCPASFNIRLVSPSIVVAHDSLITPIACNGNQASVLITGTGGIPPYTDTGIISYPAGNFQVTITDSNGCPATISLSLSQPDSLVAKVDTLIPGNCNNEGSNGSVHITVTGGVSPYTYTWGTGNFSTSPWLNHLSAGYYTFTITDGNQCQDTGSFTSYAYNNWHAWVDSTNACNGNNGTAIVQLSNPQFFDYYGFQWFNQFGAFVSSADSIGSLSPGQYSVSVTYEDGCDTTIYVNIIQATVAFTISNDTAPGIQCYGGRAIVTVSASGGYPPYTGAGQYSFDTVAGVVVIGDQSGCVANDTINLWQPTPLITSVAQRSLSCSTAFGSVLITTTGGIPPYSINFNGAHSYEDTVSLTGGLGNYNLQVTDSSGCVQYVSFTIISGNLLYGTLATINPTCNGSGDGETIITMLNGYTPYRVNGVDFYTPVIVFDSLSAGNKTYQVSDSLGCAASFSVSLGQPDALVIDSNLLRGAITCIGLNDAVIGVTAMGGTPPYQYSLFNFSTTSVTNQPGNTFGGLNPGNYQVTVIDSNNCSADLDLNIPPFIPGHDSIVVDSAVCYGTNTGVIKVYPLPSNRNPYTFSLNGGAAQVFNVFYNLPADSYQVVVSDSNQCKDTLNVSIGQPDSIDGRVWLNGVLLPIDSTTLTSRDYANFSKLSNNPWSVTFSPVTPYIVYTDTLVQVQPRENLTYTITIYMDSLDKNCFVQYTGLIDVLEIPELPNTITPNGDGINDVWKIDLIKFPNPAVTIFDRWGEIVYGSSDYNNEWGGIDQKSGKKLPDGTYFYLLKVPSQNNAVYKGNINIVDASR